MTFSNAFEDLEVWKEARELVRAVRAICKRARANHDYDFIDQISSAARSITSNIAEGSEATTNPEFILFLGYAKRSAGEVRSQLYDALDEKYVDEIMFKILTEKTRKIGRMLGAFMRYLADHPATRNPKHATKPVSALGSQ